jgi:hypothetical protein
LAAGGISNLYQPRTQQNGVNVMLGNSAMGIGTSALTNLLQEFLIRRFTPGAK